MILIVGAGVSGQAAANLAKKYLNESIVLVDQMNSTECLHHPLGVEMVFAPTVSSFQKLVDESRLIVVSPGIDPNGFFASAFQEKDKVVGELEFASRYCKLPFWAITGTNGKTTTVEMVTHILNKSGRKVVAAGNIGVPFSEVVLNQALYDGVVLEVSSFQLENIERFHPELVAVLNVTSDHLDRYHGVDEYRQTKLKLLKTVNHPKNALVTALLNEHQYTEYGSMNSPLHRIHGLALWRGETLFEEKELPFGGEHNYDNALVASWFCYNIGIPSQQIALALKSFKVGAHRMEMVPNKLGILVINDSKSTNPDALIKCIETYRSKSCHMVLIAGGRDKQMDFGKTVQLVENNIKTAVLIGESAYKLNRLWEKSTLCLICHSFSEAIAVAVSQTEPGDILVLSPGCASQDMFRNYKDRGEQFCEQILRS
jgi:UDP-N-acetylmuramoylalanine--D-glutamate ligase